MDTADFLKVTDAMVMTAQRGGLTPDLEKRVLERAYFMYIGGVSDDQCRNYFEALRIELALLMSSTGWNQHYSICPWTFVTCPHLKSINKNWWTQFFLGWINPPRASGGVAMAPRSMDGFFSVQIPRLKASAAFKMRRFRTWKTKSALAASWMGFIRHWKYRGGRFSQIFFRWNYFQKKQEEQSHET